MVLHLLSYGMRQVRTSIYYDIYHAHRVSSETGLSLTVTKGQRTGGCELYIYFDTYLVRCICLVVNLSILGSPVKSEWQESSDD